MALGKKKNWKNWGRKQQKGWFLVRKEKADTENREKYLFWTDWVIESKKRGRRSWSSTDIKNFWKELHWLYLKPFLFKIRMLLFFFFFFQYHNPDNYVHDLINVSLKGKF